MVEGGQLKALPGSRLSPIVDGMTVDTFLAELKAQ